MLKDEKGAIEDFTYVLKTEPDNINSLYNRGSSYLALKDYMKAIKDLDKVISLQRDHFKAIVNRGICYLEQDKFEAAIDNFNLAIGLQPANGEGFYMRGIAHLNSSGVTSAAFKTSKNKKIVRENNKKIQLACSDFEKARDFKYGKAIEMIAEYCR
jgi:tetratricopeptide (TPR) repeat protein